MRKMCIKGIALPFKEGLSPTVHFIKQSLIRHPASCREVNLPRQQKVIKPAVNGSEVVQRNAIAIKHNVNVGVWAKVSIERFFIFW